MAGRHLPGTRSRDVQPHAAVRIANVVGGRRRRAGPGHAGDPRSAGRWTRTGFVAHAGASCRSTTVAFGSIAASASRPDRPSWRPTDRLPRRCCQRYRCRRAQRHVRVLRRADQSDWRSDAGAQWDEQGPRQQRGGDERRGAWLCASGTVAGVGLGPRHAGRRRCDGGPGADGTRRVVRRRRAGLATAAHLPHLSGAAGARAAGARAPVTGPSKRVGGRRPAKHRVDSGRDREWRRRGQALLRA